MFIHNFVKLIANFDQILRFEFIYIEMRDSVIVNKTFCGKQILSSAAITFDWLLSLVQID